MSRRQLPEQGTDSALLLDEMARFGADDADWRGGRTWSMVYHVDDAHSRFLKSAHNLFFSENALNPIAFSSLKRMESEVVQMTLEMMNAPAEAVGTMTSGGTESLLLIVKTCRDQARRHRPWIRRPEMVLPRTIHAAFDKAAHYFGVRPRYVDVGPDGRADPAAMARAIGRRTVLIAASAPQYPHGVVDPIPELGEIALQRGLPLHVDACFGGYLLPWLERLGVSLPTWDFRIPGVSSISADTHKFGYAAKGAGVLMYRSMSLMRHQFFVSTDWPGGIYASPTIAGTRPGGPIAAAWGAMMHLGEDGYLSIARRAWEAAERLRAGIAKIDGLHVVGLPHATIVTWAASEPALDVYAIADQLEAVGWSTDRQHRPACIHCTVNASNAPAIDRYLEDLAQAVAHVRDHPELSRSGDAAMYGMMAKIPARGLVRHSVGKVLESMYGPGGGMPDLSALGSEPEHGRLLGLMHRHGDRIDRITARIQGWL